MNLLTKILFFGLHILSINIIYPASPISTNEADFIDLSNDYIDHVYFRDNPTLATIAGNHDFDHQLEDYSKSAIKNHLQLLKQYKMRFKLVDNNKLNEWLKGNREIILNQIDSEYLTLATIKPWEKNPDFYPSLMANSVLILIERNFASKNERLNNIIAREKAMLYLLKNAEVNIKNPAKIYTEIALQQLPATIHFFASDLPHAFISVNDRNLIKNFNSSNFNVIAALKNYKRWLESSVLSRSHGDFRLSTDIFRRKLKYDEMVDASLSYLLTIGFNELHKDQLAFKQVAQKINPHISVQEILTQLNTNHPRANKLLDAFQQTFSMLITFIKTHHILSLPETQPLLLKETPSFLRATLTVTIDAPGPFETHDKTTYLTVTLPDSHWDAQKQNDYLSQFNYPEINSIAIHSAYPGHYIQLSWLPFIHDRVRQLFAANSNDEGWTLYCEQMMLDEGFGQTSHPQNIRTVNLLRFAQLHEALLRDARYIVSIKMQTGKMSMDQAIRFFETEAYQTHVIAEKEAKRNATDPLYLSYTLGKIQILKLRDDLQAKLGKKFNLEAFHNALMRQGRPPIKIVREALLHDNSDAI